MSSKRKIRFHCRDCAKKKRGGFFSLEINEANISEIRCPYCNSKNVKRLG